MLLPPGACAARKSAVAERQFRVWLVVNGTSCSFGVRNVATTLSGAVSVRAAVGNHRGDRPQQYLEIQRERPVADVVQIQSHHVVEWHLAAATHLPEPSQSWYRAQPPELPVFIFRHLFRQ